MRVLHIITKNITSSAQTVLAHIANSLVQKSYQVSIVTGEVDGLLWTILGDSKKNNCTTHRKYLHIKVD